MIYDSRRSDKDHVFPNIFGSTHITNSDFYKSSPDESHILWHKVQKHLILEHPLHIRPFPGILCLL